MEHTDIDMCISKLIGQWFRIYYKKVKYQEWPDPADSHPTQPKTLG
jgi:hypothetical protein